MRTSDIKSKKNFKVTKNNSYGIQNYDIDNNYPQKVDEIIRASGTGFSCLDTKFKFVFGKGFKPEVGNLVINAEGQTVNGIAELIVRDFCKFRGFGVHVNYNALFYISSLYHTPFEHIRLGLPDDNNRVCKLATHPDWTRRNECIKKFNKKDIEWISVFNPVEEVIEEQARENGWPRYKGQLLYYSSDGDLVYPEPDYASQLKNMRTEEAVDVVTCRNAACNFMPGAILIDYNNTSESEEQLQELQDRVDDFIGDDESGSILVMQVNSKEEKPEKVDLSGENRDKYFTATNEYIPDRIGRCFQQPPILRAVDVGSNFGADAIRNAYDFYNAVTEPDRNKIEGIFKRLLALSKYDVDPSDVEIIPLTYSVGSTINERVGSDGMGKIIELLSTPDSEISHARKRALLYHGFGLSDIEINELLKV